MIKFKYLSLLRIKLMIQLELFVSLVCHILLKRLGWSHCASVLLIIL